MSLDWIVPRNLFSPPPPSKLLRIPQCFPIPLLNIVYRYLVVIFPGSQTSKSLLGDAFLRQMCRSKRGCLVRRHRNTSFHPRDNWASGGFLSNIVDCISRCHVVQRQVWVFERERLVVRFGQSSRNKRRRFRSRYSQNMGGSAHSHSND